jgi:hypothetical protein
MGLIEQIRDENFHYQDLKDVDTLRERFDEIEIGDWTICFNDRKINPYNHRYTDEKMETLSRGVLYKVLDKTINKRGDMVIKIVNDLNKKLWTLTDRFAYNPELAQNNVREGNLKWLLNDEEIELK